MGLLDKSKEEVQLSQMVEKKAFRKPEERGEILKVSHAESYVMGFSSR